MRFRLLEPQAVREPEGRQPVGDSVVDHLRDVALLSRHFRGKDSERLPGGPRMQILAGKEAVAQHRIPGDVRQDAQLDLAVVRAEQLPSRARNERLADLRAERRPDGDVLEIWIDRGEPAGGGDRLIERGVQTPVLAERRG